MKNKDIKTKDKKQISHNQDYQSNKPDSASRYLKINNWIMAAILLVTAIYSFFAYLQWRTIREQTESGNRAFVFMKAIHFYKVINDKTNKVDGWNILIDWENCGNTPTKNMEVSIYLDSVDRLFPDSYEFSDYSPAKRYLIDIAPHRTTRIGPMYISVSEIIRLQKGGAYCYIYGFANYHDILPNTPKHITEFCVKVIQIIGDLTDPDISKTIMVHYINHHKNNCYDEECGK